MLGSLLHKVLQGIFLILFLAGVVLSAAGAMAVANQRAQSLQSLFALERDLTAPIGELGQIKEKSRAHMTGVDRSAARQRAAFRLLVLSAPAALAGFLGLAAYTGAHLRRRPKLTERDAIWKLRRTEQYALGLLVVGLALVAFGSSSYLQSAREHATAAGEGIALARRLADAEFPTNSVLMAQSDDLISQATRFRQGIINATRKGTNGLSCMGLGFAACGVGLVALWFLTAPPFTS